MGFIKSSERADRIADETYKRLQSRPAIGDRDDDGSRNAEVATEEGQLYYEMLTGMRQATINLHTAGLFHLLEQQLGALISITFDGSRLKNGNLSSCADFFCDFLGLDLRSLPQWEKINELRLVANATKHGEGGSEQDLRKVRPELFISPYRAKMGFTDVKDVNDSLRLPLAGDGLFITEEIFAEYSSAGYDMVRAILSHFAREWRTLFPIGS
jgi:hypothetical protein